jgi:hypothetical protein
VNHRLRRRHRYLVALVAAGVLLAAFLVASRPLPDGRSTALPAALEAAP